MLNQWKGWSVLISLALVTTWLLYSLEEKFLASNENSLRVPDYTLTDFKTIQMDEHGHLKNQLMAETMTHYPDTNTHLTAPQMVFYKENGQPKWTVRAEQGEVSSNGNQIWLLGHTTLLQQSTPSQPEPLKIISQDVRVQLDTEYAETAAPTTIVSNYGETHSVGMRVWIPTEKIELLSQVRGHYVFP